MASRTGRSPSTPRYASLGLPPARPPAPSAAHAASLFSYGHKHPRDDTDSSSANDSSSDAEKKGDTGSSSSGEEDEKPKRRQRQKQDFKVSPVVVVLAIALVVAVALAVYFGTRALSSPQAATPSSGGSTNTGAGAAGASQALTTSAPVGTPSNSHVDGTSQPSGDSRPTQSSDDHQHDDDEGEGGDDKDKGEGGSSTTATATKSSDGGEPTKTSAGGVPDATQPSSSDRTLVNQCLSEHNSFRATHHADPLTWDDTLAKAAEDWSSKCVWEHSGGKYGENLFMTAGSDMTETSEYDASLGVKAWNDEEKMCDYNNPGFSHDTGHFTQTVWKDTQRVGCHLRICQGMMDGFPWTAYLVCEYDPPGNFGDRYKDNVLPP